MRVVLLTKAFPTANALFNRLDAVVPVERVFVELQRAPNATARVSGVERLKRRLADPLREAKRLEGEALRAVFSDTVELERTPTLEYIPHNGWRGAIPMLSADPPELIVVYGTSLIPDELARLAKIATLNIHLGLAPYWRGVFCTEAAILADDFDNIGVTIHEVAPKIDGGALVAQARPPISAVDDEFTLDHKVQLEGHKLMATLLERLRGGAKLRSVPQTGTGLLVTSAGFTAAHRALVRELIRDGVVDRYLLRRQRGVSREKPIVTLE